MMTRSVPADEPRVSMDSEVEERLTKRVLSGFFGDKVAQSMGPDVAEKLVRRRIESYDAIGRAGETVPMKTTTITLATVAVALAACLTSAQSDDAALEAEAAQIETRLISPCCWRQPVSDHQSEIAGQMKDEIRQMLEAGMGRQEILDAYVGQYGARILSIPPQRGFNRLSFAMPVAFAVVGLFVVVTAIRRLRRAPAGAATVSNQEVTRRIQDELDAMDEP